MLGTISIDNYLQLTAHLSLAATEAIHYVKKEIQI